MRTPTLLVLSLSTSLLLLPRQAGAQDTTVVQTLTFDSITTRRGIWEFPAANEHFRKVLMVHTLKCDPATTWDQYECGEWDYLTYNFVHEHTGVLDSTAMQHPYFKVGNAAPDSIESLQSANSDLVQISAPTRYFLTTISEYDRTVGVADAVDSLMLDLDRSASRAQFLFTPTELIDANVLPLNIERLRFRAEDLAAVGRLVIRMKNTPSTSLSAFENVGLITVFDQYAPQFGGPDSVVTIDLVTPFQWNLTEHMLVDVSIEQDAPSPGPTLQAQNVAPGLSLIRNGRDGSVRTDNDFIGVDPAPLAVIDDQVTIMFRSWGDEVLPISTTILEGRDAQNRRMLNIHLPWSDSRVYWDAGNDGTGYDRIDKLAATADIEGQWTQWAFTKNTTTGSMKIYKNGVLWHSATGKTRPMSGIVRFNIASDADRNAPWPGRIDDFAIFKAELDAATIAAWTGKELDPSHPFWSDALYVFDFNEHHDAPHRAVNAVDPAASGWLMGTVQRVYEDCTTLRSPSAPAPTRPVFTFTQGEFNTVLDPATTVTRTIPHTLLSREIFQVSGNAAVPVDTLFEYSADTAFTFDPTGLVIDAVPPAGEMHVNAQLDYYAVPYEVINNHEIGRYITPYGIGLDLGDDGFSWVYDVTDYQHLLHDSVDLSAGNTQELIDLKFLMIHGDAPRPVVNVQQPWGPMASRSYASLSDDTQLAPVTVGLHPDAVDWMMRSRLTGHGHNSNDGNYPHCCEWKDNTHYLYANGQEVDEWHIWQENECANNPVYPQGGTWPGSREGWCPGDRVKDRDTELAPYVTGDSLTLDYGITPVPLNNLGMGGGNYVVNMDLFEFGPPPHALDAEIYHVVRPTNERYHSRENPICYDPVLILRNAGNTALTSVTFSYQVSGGAMATHTWTGNLAHMRSTAVTLPVPDPQFWAGDAAHFFLVNITGVNGGGPDAHAANDHYRTHFELPIIYPNNFVLYYKTNNRPNENDLFVRDITGQVVFSRTTLTANTIYRDTLELPPGCYEVEFTDNGNDGLSYWADPDAGTGYFRFRALTGQTLRNFEPEFGHRIYAAFGIGTITGMEEPIAPPHFSTFPNPGDGLYTIQGNDLEDVARIEVIDAAGVLVQTLTGPGRVPSMQLDISSEPVGVYVVRIVHGSGAEMLRLVKH